MRRLGLMMTVVGAVAFAALLALGLALGSDSVSAQDDATPTATPFVFPCNPTPIGTLAGEVTIDGQPAPVGTVIEVSKGGYVFGRTTTTAAGQYAVDVTMKQVDDLYPPCYTDVVEALVITCDGATATDVPATIATITDFDLACVSGEATATPTAAPEETATPTPAPEETATPTPAPEETATPTATPTVTPAVPPVTGMGSTSGGGFNWWPLALAAAAMTSVAGLFTARWARR